MRTYKEIVKNYILIYITSIKNFWLTDEISEYIYKIEVQIK